MNQADFARLHDVSRKTVTLWKSRGWLVMNGDEVDVDASNENIKNYRKPVTQPEKKKKLSEINPVLITIKLELEVTLKVTDQTIVVDGIRVSQTG